MNKKQKRRGITSIEYGIIAALIAISTLATTTLLGEKVTNNYCGITSQLQTVVNTIGESGAQCASNKNYGKGITNGYQSGGGDSCGTICLAPNVTSLDANIIYAINQMSPIVRYYGLYNEDGTPVTTLDEAIKDKNVINKTTGDGMGTDGITTPNGSQYSLEVQTANGHSYGIFYAQNEMAYRDLDTGETYGMNSDTNEITNYGVTVGDMSNQPL